MAKWFIERIKLPLKYRWSIARGSSLSRINLIISYQDGDFIGRGEVAFLTGAGISIDEAEQEFKNFCHFVPDSINGLEEMMEVLESDNLNLHSNLRFGIESAYVHFVSQLLNGSVSHVLGIDNTSKLSTSFSLPILENNNYEDFIINHNLKRFKALKVKVKGISSIAGVNNILKSFNGELWLDGNECFQSALEVKDFCQQIDLNRIEVLEQPLPCDYFDEQQKLKSMKLDLNIIADESIGSGPIYDDIAKLYDGVNIKLMKAGGYFSALRQIRQAKRLGLKVMLGCMLETSLGISSALNIANDADFIDLDSFLFLESDPFGLVFEEEGHIQGMSNQ